MNPPVLILLALVLFSAGCSLPDVLHNNPRRVIAAISAPGTNEFFYIEVDRVRTGHTDADTGYTSNATNLNDPLTAFQAGQASAASLISSGAGKGFFQQLGAWFPIIGAKAKEIDRTKTAGRGPGAIAAGAKILSEIYRPLNGATVSVDTDNTTTVSNSVAALKIIAETAAEAARLQAQLDAAGVIDKSRQADILRLIEENRRLRDQVNQGSTSTNAPGGSGIPGGNPFDTTISDEQDADQPGDPTFLWKPIRDGSTTEAAILFPFPLRIKSATANGVAFRRNSLSNGWRSTWYGPKQSGSFNVQAIDAQGKTRTWAIPDGTKRESKKSPGDVTKPTIPGTADQWGRLGGLVAVPEHDVLWSEKVPLWNGHPSNLLIEKHDPKVVKGLSPLGYQVPDGRWAYKWPAEIAAAQPVEIKLRYSKDPHGYWKGTLATAATLTWKHVNVAGNSVPPPSGF